VWCDASFCSVGSLSVGAISIDGQPVQLVRFFAGSSVQAEVLTLLFAALFAPHGSLIYSDLRDVTNIIRKKHCVYVMLTKVLTARQHILRYCKPNLRAAVYEECHLSASSEARRLIQIARGLWRVKHADHVESQEGEGGCICEVRSTVEGDLPAAGPARLYCSDSR